MSKVYKCDACGMMIEDPYQIKMKEFNIDFNINIITMTIDKKRKVKIHLCDDCFHALHDIAGRKVRNE